MRTDDGLERAGIGDGARRNQDLLFIYVPCWWQKYVRWLVSTSNMYNNTLSGAFHFHTFVTNEYIDQVK